MLLGVLHTEHFVMAELETCRNPRLSKFSLKQSTVACNRLLKIFQIKLCLTISVNPSYLLLKSLANFVQGRNRRSWSLSGLRILSSKLVAQ